MFIDAVIIEPLLFFGTLFLAIPKGGERIYFVVAPIVAALAIWQGLGELGAMMISFWILAGAWQIYLRITKRPSSK